MFYGDSIQDIRQLYFTSWSKFQQKQALSDLEQQIVQVMRDHPEYHHVFENPQTYQNHTYYPELGESNPFLHMGLHLGIREQVSTNRPAGINAVFQQLMNIHQDPLHVEHLMMEQLAECIWLAQKHNVVPDEAEYLAKLKEALIQ